MFRFLLKTLIVAGILFFGIIIGFQEANHGLLKMKGYADENFTGAFTVEEAANGEYEATILGETVTSHDLEGKKKILEEMNNYNFFTDIAKKVSNLISNFVTNLFPS
ncbi:YqxA family protein [Caldibacillus lycopersici]|uniref:YqxA family protein n=1 Tax=Perspicuibacillus lycopersici TaxID=1325689 RepID=A0AAE3ITN0_9BACI|nr:YqxA family protein [Perspicuibacillus lycopersici]MCU9613937.1 YqxA family protein [Perspicuibacillus lycopersici]